MELGVGKLRHAWNEPGHAHFFTYSCVHRWPLLSRERTRRWVLHAMENTRQKLDVALWAYVIMPEHVHLLCFPREPVYRCEQILASLKRSVSATAKEFLVTSGNQLWLERLTVTHPHRVVFQFWQPGGGYDRNVWQSRSVPPMMEYVHGNPVRRGLVSDPLDWSWSSARYWHDGSGPLKMDALEL